MQKMFSANAEASEVRDTLKIREMGILKDSLDCVWSSAVCTDGIVSV